MKKMLSICLLSSVVLLGACSKETKTTDNQKNSAQEASQKTDAPVASSKEVENSEENADSSVDENGMTNVFYTADFSDDWHSLETKINNVIVAKAKEPETQVDGTKIEAVMGVQFSITNNSENNIMDFPNQANLVIEGQQVKADMVNSDASLGGEILPGVNKTGKVLFSIPKLDDPKNIKSIRLSWQATDTKVEDVNDYSKTYDVEIPLTISDKK